MKMYVCMYVCLSGMTSEDVCMYVCLSGMTSEDVCMYVCQV